MTEAAATAALSAPAVTEPVATPQPTVSEKFSVLASKEKQLQRKREEHKARENSLAAKEADLSRREAEAKALVERYGTKPKTALEALDRYGFSYKDATDLALNEGQPTAEQIARGAEERVAALERQREEDGKAARDAAQKEGEARAAAAIDDFKGEITEYLSTKKDDYELITLHEAKGVVYDTIEEFFNRSRAEDAAKRGVPGEQGQGRVLSIKEAADLVEEYLAEQIKQSLDTKKFKANGQPDAKAPQAGKPSETSSAPRRTVTNDLTSSTPTLLTPRVEEDRMRRALAALG